VLGAENSRISLLIYRLATQVWLPSDTSNRDMPAPRGAWRQGVLRHAIDPATVG